MIQIAARDTAALRAVLDTVFAGPAYRWAETPGFLARIREWWYGLGEWLRGLEIGNPALFRLLIIALLIGLLAIFAHAAFMAYRAVRGAVADTEKLPARAAAEHHNAAWYRREADRAAADGRVLDAMQLAFTALALSLDARGLLRYHASMTPAECARLAAVSDTDRARLRHLVGTLYAHAFGGRPCGSEDYERWRAVSAFAWDAAPH